VAPDRALIARASAAKPRIRRGFLGGTPTHHPLLIITALPSKWATTPYQPRADFVTPRGLLPRVPAGEHRVDGACGSVEPLLELA
jgi:hypothetical protein